MSFSPPHAHLVVLTEYRRGVLDCEHIRYLTKVFTNVRRDFGATFLACNAEDDHVHPAGRILAEVPVSALMSSLKGVPVRRLR